MSADSRQAPGEARAAGHSVADTLRSDRVPPPQQLLEESYRFLGDERITASRYTSEQFAARETASIWAHTWQWTCRAAQLPEPGDLTNDSEEPACSGGLAYDFCQMQEAPTIKAVVIYSYLWLKEVSSALDPKTWSH